MPRIVRHEIVKDDLVGLAAHIARDRVSAAEKFIEAVDKSLKLLAAMPELGTLCEFRNPSHSGLRYLTIKRFENYLILYRPIEDGIEVVRVLHGSRDIEAIFEDLPPEP